MSLETEDNGILENNIHQSEHNGLETNGKLSNAMDDVNISTKSPLIDNGNDENSSIKNVSEELQVNSHENSHVIYDFNNIQELVSTNEFSDSSGKNLLRGCKWSPDGTCILTNSQDNTLRLFNLPNELYSSNTVVQDLKPLQSVLRMQEGGLIYDFCWYPLMSSWEPLTCCLASTSAKSPIHLWDAYSSELRATYRIYDNADEVTSAVSLNFSPAGDQLFCGLKNMIAVFDTAIPGRDYFSLKMKDMKGIISCIAFSPVAHQIMAAGTYSKALGLFSLDDNSLMCTLNGHRGGLTHIMFSPDGTKLYSGARKDHEILCWDLRNPGSILFSLIRTVETNQRIYFDLSPDGKYVISGTTCGTVKVWDTTQPPEEVNGISIIRCASKFQAHNDCANGLSLNRHRSLLATSSGQHHVEKNLLPLLDDEEDPVSLPSQAPENSLKLWQVGSRTKSNILLS
ncbi:unnamed protein product [Bemisia tabaci]|uniref:WD repeat-containing protein 79 n=1 Tax=Bemisia tabaci TaxID=7038 RepID=A0A9P0AMJ6_BEMTA|nr:unnamed protein product [Bemisia tabaci]